MDPKLLAVFEENFKASVEAFGQIGSYKGSGNARKKQRVALAGKLGDLIGIINRKIEELSTTDTIQVADVFSLYFHVEMARILIGIMGSHGSLTQSSDKSKVTKVQFALVRVSASLNAANKVLARVLQSKFMSMESWLKPLLNSCEQLSGLLTEKSGARDAIQAVMKAARFVLVNKPGCEDRVVQAIRASQFSGLVVLVGGTQKLSASHQVLRASYVCGRGDIGQTTEYDEHVAAAGR
jgi:hypothetical protein